METNPVTQSIPADGWYLVELIDDTSYITSIRRFASRAEASEARDARAAELISSTDQAMYLKNSKDGASKLSLNTEAMVNGKKVQYRAVFYLYKA